MVNIPYGETLTYLGLSQKMDNEAAIRAAAIPEKIRIQVRFSVMVSAKASGSSIARILALSAADSCWSRA